MMVEQPEEKPKKRKPAEPPIELPLEMKREPREHLSLFRVQTDLTLTPSDLFCVFPAVEGKGWVLRLYRDTE